MVNTPVQFWAVVICTLGAGLGVAALYAPGVDSQARVMAFALANSLVSGGLGAFTASHIATKLAAAPENPTQGPAK